MSAIEAMPPALAADSKLGAQRARAKHARDSKKPKKQASAFALLSPRQRLFVYNYIKLNYKSRDAALAAGYTGKNVHVTASQLLSMPKIKDALREHLAQFVASAEAVTARITEVAFHNPMDHFKGDGQLDYASLKERGYLVSEFDASEGLGKAKVKFQSQTPALALLSKIHGLLVDKQEVSGPSGGPQQHSLGLTPEQLAVVMPKKQEDSK